MGKYDLGCEGSTYYETPNIDRLASRSCRFANAYSACQVCSPSRVAIQTGRSPTRIPITDYISPDGANQPEQWRRNTRLLPASFELQMPLAEQTIAEALKPLGYHNFFAGKWHLGGEGFSPTDQGYDINVGGGKYGHPPNGYFSPYRIVPLHDGAPGEQLPLRLARETAGYIHSRADQSAPFFAMLSFYSVHSPIQTTQTLWSKYRDKAEQLGLATSGPRFIFDRIQEVRQTQDSPLYAGMMESLDDAVGIVLDSLEQSGLTENTVVLFTSDNGGVSSGDGYATAVLPLRGGKGRQWEGGIRQPLYIHLPGQTNETHSDVLTIATDLFPTLLELAVEKRIIPPMKMSDQPVARLDGRSLVPALNGQAMDSRPLFWHYPHYGNQGGEPCSIIRNKSWKLIHYYEDGRDELYNLDEDLGEQNDLAAKQVEQTSQLSTLLTTWLEQSDARYPTINSRYDEAVAAESLEQAHTVRMAQREAEQAALYESSFVPRGGWWQDRGEK
ncbi:MAG: sulfatase, partial [Aureliella sp.]